MNDKEYLDTTASTIFRVCLALMFALGGVFVTYAIIDHANKVEAVQHGHARWVVDELGKRSFEWLPRCSQAQPDKEKK